MTLIERLEKATEPSRELDAEIWRPIRGYDGLYQVSNHGRVRRDPATGHDFLLSTGPTDSGCYRRISLHNNGVRSGRDLHTIVAEAFLPPKPTPRHQIRHLDGDIFNNRASNLKWGTVKENAEDRERHGRTATGKRHGMYGRRLSGTANGYAKLQERDVLQIRSLAGTKTQRDIAKQFGVHQGVVWRIIARKSWTHI